MTKRGVGRPRDGNPAETRRQILRSAEECFARSGYEGATTRQVASRAGVNVATLHYHFGNKEGLYRAVLGEVLKGELPEPRPRATPEALRQVVEELYDFGVARPTLSRLALLHLLAGPVSPAPQTEPEDPRVAVLSRSLAGEGDTGSAEANARSIVNLIDAALVSQVAQGQEPGHETARAGVVAAALRLTAL